MIKKLAFLLALCMLVSCAFFACNDGETPANENEPAANTPDTNTPDTNTPDTNTPDTNTPDTNTPDTSTPEDDDLAFEYNPRLSKAWRKDDNTVVFKFDTFVQLPDANLLENIYIASTADGDAIATPVSYISYNGELSKTWEVKFEKAIPAAGEFYLCLIDVNGDGDAALATTFTDYSGAGIYGETKKGGVRVAAVQVTDEEITDAISLYMEWVKIVADNVVAVKYNQEVATDWESVDSYGHVAHLAPLVNGQLIVPATEEDIEYFPECNVGDYVQRHTRYFFTYEKDPTIVLFVWSSEFRSTSGSGDTADISCVNWWNAVQTRGEAYTLIVREFPYDCITSVETGKMCSTSRDIPIESVDIGALDLDGIMGVRYPEEN